MTHLIIMFRRLSVLFAALALAAIATFLVAAAAPPVDALGAQQADEEVPPGNPVIGSDRPGDVEPESDTNYALWAVVAVCLIGAGTLLVKVERWEARRVPE